MRAKEYTHTNLEDIEDELSELFWKLKECVATYRSLANIQNPILLQISLNGLL
jgi:hypothetical protein